MAKWAFGSSAEVLVMKRNYLAVFLLPFRDHEHAEIPRIIREFSGGDCHCVFDEGHARGYLFSTEYLPWEISFDNVLMKADSVLIVELGRRSFEKNMRAEDRWLKAHKTARPGK
jgi:hypothetical protein